MRVMNYGKRVITDRLLIGMRMFSNQQQEIVIEPEEPILKDTEKREFKAETKKLLDIVAKSIYTDKEVFVRELLSNCSDALEKQRFRLISGQAVTSSDDLYINIITNSKERTITIFDSGVGMTREEVVDNLGTIARSGSQQFVKDMKDKDQVVSDTIIGQFGVGFYSTFIVADSVEVLSKSDGQKGIRWVSDGSVSVHD
jgi:TNF receptor-associated protein 1